MKQSAGSCANCFLVTYSGLSSDITSPCSVNFKNKHEHARTLPNIICKQNRTLGKLRHEIVLKTFIESWLGVFLWDGRKNVDLPNIFGIIKGIFRIESDRAD